MPLRDKHKSFSGPQLLSSVIQGEKLFCDEVILMYFRKIELALETSECELYELSSSFMVKN